MQFRFSSQRTSRSLLGPGLDVPPGAGMCLECPSGITNQDDPVLWAEQHRDKFGHPTIAKRREQPATR